MRRALLIGGAALALTSALAMAQSAPESILPPGFDDPTPTPSATPAPRPSAAPSSAPTPGATTSIPVIQPLPGGETLADGGAVPLPDNLPSLDQLEKMSTDELDAFLGLKPTIDIPPAARRSMARVGVIAPDEGGLPVYSLANQPASLVRAAIAGTKGPLVSRWGHILLRRALASRLEAPAGMDPAEFAGLRAAALNRLGEFAAARALVQDVDTANWSPLLTASALDAYLGTADIVGACPAIRLQGNVREDGTWRMWQSICNAYAGEGARAGTDLNRIRSRGLTDRIDVLLAQRYAGAAGSGRSGVTIEWDGVDHLTPWRFALANAVGEDVPQSLIDNAAPYYARAAATAPMLGLPQRIAASDMAGREGILSARAMVDLYAQLHAAEDVDGDAADTADTLRDAYVLPDPAKRVAAIKDIWGSGGAVDYGRQVLTAYAAARLVPAKDLVDDAAPLIASMLAAGLERDALRWATVVPEGTEAWALLVFADPYRSNAVPGGAIDNFVGDDASAKKRKSAFFVAGLAGLGRISQGAANSYSRDMKLGLGSQTRWTAAIDRAAAVDNRALVALLAGLGMQGSGWDKMTPRYLYHIVSALNRVGMTSEARMIAAEAVARG
jgi:hypothetical protein